jgi:cysteine desulfurase
MKEIYLDNAATTKVYPEVIEAIGKAMSEEYGNPSSIHEVGEKAFKTMNLAREKLAKEIGANPWEIVFTSGGTEANNLGILGSCRSNGYGKKKKILISSIEHPSVVEAVRELKKEGWSFEEIGVDPSGRLKIENLEKKINGETKLVSIIQVNNEIGVVQDLKKIGKICRKKEVIFHSDAVQGFGKLKIDVKKMEISLLSASAHKIGGPKGIGLLYVKEGVKLEGLSFGGGQERGLRSGTENVPGIVGFAKALDLIKKVDWPRIEKLRNKLDEGLVELGGKVSGSNRIAGISNISFPGIDGESLVFNLSDKRIMASTGSACSSKKKSESKTLKAIGLNKKEISGSVRFSLGNEIGEKEISYVVEEVKKILDMLRI